MSTHKRHTSSLALVVIALVVTSDIADANIRRALKLFGEKTLKIGKFRREPSPPSLAHTGKLQSKRAKAKQNQQKAMTSTIKGSWLYQGATPPLALFLESGGSMRETVSSALAASRAARFEVTNLEADGNVSLSLLLPVSGHTTLANANTWATTNVYHLQLTDPDGVTRELPQIKSTGLVTEARIDVVLKRGRTLIQFWPEGSFGIDGFYSGRTVEIDWEGP